MSTIKTVVASVGMICIYKDRVYAYNGTGAVKVFDLDLNVLYEKDISRYFSSIAAANDSFYGIESNCTIHRYDLNLNLIRTVLPDPNCSYYKKMMVGPTGKIYFDYYSSNIQPSQYYVKELDAQLNYLRNYGLGLYETDYTVTPKGTIAYIYKESTWSDKPIYIGYIGPTGNQSSYNSYTPNINAVGASTVSGFYLIKNSEIQLYAENAVSMASVGYNVYSQFDYRTIVPDSFGGLLTLRYGGDSNYYLNRIVSRIKYEQP